MYDEDDSVNIKGHCIHMKEAVNTKCEEVGLLGRKKQQQTISLQRNTIRILLKVWSEKAITALNSIRTKTVKVEAQKYHTTVTFLCCCMAHNIIVNKTDPNITREDL